MEAATIIVPAQVAYAHIPASELRAFTDGVFSGFAVNPLADSARGFGHRYVAGHDLFLDVPKTLASHGPSEAYRHAGHVILTDFPTKAGIPIPFFSQSGLGHFLEQAGIDRGWLQISAFDTGIGILAVAEGTSDLIQALQGNLSMNWGVFFDTFGEGAIEVGFGLSTQNPVLLFAGIENLLTGIAATWNKLTIYVDPLDFFGASLFSGIVGFIIAYGLIKEDLSSAAMDAVRSGIIGGMYAVSSAFGFGTLLGFAAYRLGAELAKQHNAELNACLTISPENYQLLVDELCRGNIAVTKILYDAIPCVDLSATTEIFKIQAVSLDCNAQIFAPRVDRFLENHLTFDSLVSSSQGRATQFNLNPTIPILSGDPVILECLYQQFRDGRK